MKLTIGILVLGMAAGTAWGQNPNVIDNTRNTLKAVQQKQAIDSDTALAASQGRAANPATPASTQPVSALPVSGSKATLKNAPTAHKTRSAAKIAQVSPASKVSGKATQKLKTTAAHKKSQPKQQIAVEDQKKPKEAKADETKKVNLSGRRDPFISPVMNRSMVGSGCSTGKRCLAIDQI